MTKAKGISCHIGLNRVGPTHYSGWSGPLNACEFDARDLETIAQQQGYTTNLLLTENATRDAVITAIRNAAEALKPGDIFLLTYSGHGGQVPDVDGDERDLEDETWCLYDGQMIDDELHAMWPRFEEGVRVFVLSDSCHSGTVVKLRAAGMALPSDYRMALDASESGSTVQGPAMRMMPIFKARETYLQHKEFYDDLAKKVPDKTNRGRIQATVRLISGCQDNQFSLDGAFNGLFTGTLKRVWADGRFQGDYSEFHRDIISSMPPQQSPNHFVIGVGNPTFDAEKPFTI